MKFSFRNSAIAALFTALVSLVVNCGNPEQPPEKSVAGYLNHSDTARYIGMNQCRLCHQGIYESFLQTGMGQSFEHASKEKSAATFGKHAVIHDKYSDYSYYPFWDKDSMKIMEFRLQGKDTVHKRIETVDYIIGSGQHTNSHIHNTNGYLHQMPMTFYAQKKQWDLPPGFENGINTRFSRKIGLECMSCHNSLPDFVKGSENKYNSLPEGINCERCHGPGSIHVQQRQQGIVVDTSKYIDYSIVNPGKLPVDLQFDVCQRCHLQGNTVLKEGKSFLDFKPGMKLSDYMTVFLPRYKNADDQFIMASHADRLKQSPCFIKSFQPETATGSLRPYKSSMTCVTCHNPHVSVKVTGKEVFNNACKNCHNGVKSTNLCTEKQEVRNKVQDNCVSCHMPKSGSIDIPHVTVHDHYIRKPVKKDELEKIKEFIGLYAVNEKRPDNQTKAKAYIQQYDKFESNPTFLDSAKKYLTDKTTEDIKSNFTLLVHLNFSKQDYNSILAYVSALDKDYLLNSFLTLPSWDNSHAWTAYRIGEAYSNTGNIMDAYLFYKRATELAPYYPDFKNKLGTSLMAQQKVQEAMAIFSDILKENPKFVQALNNLGYASLVTGNSAEAENLYTRALKLDPDYEPLLMNVAGLHIYKKEYTEAKKILNRVIKKNPSNLQAKKVLEQLAG
ncbi:MAG: tetratricopeptide repeat protein [Bacteroidia bacterium]|jgi:tetratricopeptide (TPR) repeat protein